MPLVEAFFISFVFIVNSHLFYDTEQLKHLYLVTRSIFTSGLILSLQLQETSNKGSPGSEIDVGRKEKPNDTSLAGNQSSSPHKTMQVSSPVKNKQGGKKVKMISAHKKTILIEPKMVKKANATIPDLSLVIEDSDSHSGPKKKNVNLSSKKKKSPRKNYDVPKSESSKEPKHVNKPSARVVKLHEAVTLVLVSDEVSSDGEENQQAKLILKECKRRTGTILDRSSESEEELLEKVICSNEEEHLKKSKRKKMICSDDSSSDNSDTCKDSAMKGYSRGTADKDCTESEDELNGELFTEIKSDSEEEQDSESCRAEKSKKVKSKRLKDKFPNETSSNFESNMDSSPGKRKKDFKNKCHVHDQDTAKKHTSQKDNVVGDKTEGKTHVFSVSESDSERDKKMKKDLDLKIMGRKLNIIVEDVNKTKLSNPNTSKMKRKRNDSEESSEMPKRRKIKNVSIGYSSDDATDADDALWIESDDNLPLIKRRLDEDYDEEDLPSLPRNKTFGSGKKRRQVIDLSDVNDDVPSVKEGKKETKQIKNKSPKKSNVKEVISENSISSDNSESELKHNTTKQKTVLSHSDSDSENDTPLSKQRTSKPTDNIHKLSAKKESKTTKLQKPVSSDSDSDSENDTPLSKQKTPKPTDNTHKLSAKKESKTIKLQKPVSSDSDSDSENDTPVSKQKTPKPTDNIHKLSAKKESKTTKLQTPVSSDSDSDSENDTPLSKQKTPKPTDNTHKLSAKKESKTIKLQKPVSSDSDSDSENDTPVSKQKTPKTN